MTEAPKWEDRYHPKKIDSRGSAPKGWAPEYQYCPYVREDEHDRIVAEKNAEVARLTRIIVEMAIPLEALRMIGGMSGDINGEIVNATNLARDVAAHAALGEGDGGPAPVSDVTPAAISDARRAIRALAEKG